MLIDLKIRGVNMSKNLFVVAIVLVILLVGFTGCEELSDVVPSEEDRFIGYWENKTGIFTITFFSDGECQYHGMDYLWEIKEGKLKLTDVIGEIRYYDYNQCSMYIYHFLL